MTKPRNQAIAHAAEQKWFVREREEFFPFFYYWDSPNEMKEYIDEDWEDFISVDEATWKNVRSTVGGGGCGRAFASPREDDDHSLEEKESMQKMKTKNILFEVEIATRLGARNDRWKQT